MSQDHGVPGFVGWVHTRSSVFFYVDIKLYRIWSLKKKKNIQKSRGHGFSYGFSRRRLGCRVFSLEMLKSTRLAAPPRPFSLEPRQCIQSGGAKRPAPLVRG